MDDPINPRIRAWLEAGDAEASLLGRGRYLVHDVDFGGHDRILALNQLIKWASEGHSNEASTAFLSAMDTLLREKCALDAAYLLLAYLLVSRDRRSRLVERGDVQTLATRVQSVAADTLPPGMFEQIESEIALADD